MVEKKDSESIVLKCVSEHPGETTEGIKQELDGILSNGPINAALQTLKEKGMIRTEKKKTNQRGNKWVVVETNPLVIIPEQIDRLEVVLIDLLESCFKMYRDYQKSRPSQPRTEREEQEMAQILYDVFERYLDYIQGFFIYTAFVLPNTFSDKEMASMLVSTAFKKLVNIQIKLSKKLETFEIPMLVAEIVPELESLPLSMRSPNVLLMYHKKFSKFGLGVAARPLLDLIWQFAKPFRDPWIKDADLQGDGDDWFTIAKKIKG